MDKGQQQPKLKQLNPFAISSESRSLHYAARILTVAIAVGAFVLSFNALTSLAEAAGIANALSWVWAASVDGFILIATVATFVLQNKGKSRFYAWSILILFVVISVFGNGWHAVLATTDGFKLPTWAAVVITAIPPATLFLSIHLLILMIQPNEDQRKELDRNRKKSERLKAIEDKEIERLETQELRKEIRESRAAELVSGATYTATPIAAPPQIIPPQSVVPLASPQPIQQLPANYPQSPVPYPQPYQSVAETTGGSGVGMSDSQMIEYLEERLALNEDLPTGAAVARMLNKGERTGQNFIKKFKEGRGLI